MAQKDAPSALVGEWACVGDRSSWAPGRMVDSLGVTIFDDGLAAIEC